MANATRHSEKHARILSLFAGVGGLERGLELAGVGRTVAQCEIESFPREVLALRFPNATRHEDVRTLTAADVGAVDVICGGFPCQDVSNAGKKAGIAEGTRSGLWYEYARLVRECRPAWVVIENVAALVSDGLGIVLADLSAAGYDAAWDCVPAAAVGAPHRRDRAFIIAWRRDVCAPPLDVSQAWRDVVAATRAKYGASEGDAWPTPRASENENRQTRPTPSQLRGEHGMNLATAVNAPMHWPTPRAEMDSGAHRGQPDTLHSAVKTWPGWPAGAWPTPAAGLPNDGETPDAWLARKAFHASKASGATRAGMPLAIAARIGSMWPAGPRQPQHAWEPPRTAKGVKDRAKRLKALGNAVVPQAAEAVGLALLAIRDGAGNDDARPVVARLEGRRWTAPQGGLFEAVEVTRFPRAGTMRGGVAYELTPCAPLASLTLGSPSAGEAWPTTCATDASGAWNATSGRRNPNSTHSPGVTLSNAMRMWPTPMSRDGKDTGDMSRVNARDGRPADTLPRVVFQGGCDVAPLNPEWVETLMGFPMGWTESARMPMREVA